MISNFVSVNWTFFSWNNWFCDFKTQWSFFDWNVSSTINNLWNNFLNSDWNEVITVYFNYSGDWCSSLCFIFGNEYSSVKFWDSSQWNIGVISNIECVYWSLNLWLNWRKSINLNWCSFNWNEGFSIDSHRLSVSGISRNEILSINSENSWFFRSWFDSALEYSSIRLWNAFKRNVSFISDIESVYFALLVDFYFCFDGIIGF